MSLRPIDLQVNMNASMQISQQEGAKMADAAALQRQMDRKNLQDGIQQQQTVTGVGDNPESQAMKDSELDYIEPEKREGGKPGKEKKRSQTPPEPKKENPPPTEKSGNHQVDFLA